VDVAVRFPPAQSGGLPGAVACTVAIAKAFRPAHDHMAVLMIDSHRGGGVPSVSAPLATR